MHKNCYYLFFLAAYLSEAAAGGAYYQDKKLAKRAFDDTLGDSKIIKIDDIRKRASQNDKSFIGNKRDANETDNPQNKDTMAGNKESLNVDDASLSSMNKTTVDEKKPRANRIINGSPASIKDFPFAAFLYREENEKGHFCGGSLIAPNAILTAAHCLVDSKFRSFDVNKYTVSVGSEHHIEKNPNIYDVSLIAIHPAYNVQSTANDIGIIFLKKPIPSNIAKPTKIYNSNVYDDMPVLAAGWGATKSDLSVPNSDVLNYAQIKITSGPKCSRFDKTWSNNYDSKICTESFNGKDTCYGDSGGPLVANVPGLKPLVGITSGIVSLGEDKKFKCGISESATYYTNAYFFVDWISKVTSIPLKTLLHTGQRNPNSINNAAAQNAQQFKA
ncbi:hypothetical protein BB561_001323 [Smittium simulii]|uniref:Peptidase S1 domain-containing protein n=1 Tax=Smittium simulii TaxID=133385 RepID=A0A2T9YV32_9FUNG|nr:hypothetical protein BB561_001323 [Smittium simulii]